MRERPWLPIATITGWQTTASVCFYGVFAGTSLFRDTFGLTGAKTGLILTALMLGYTLCLFPVGALIDAHGERPMMLVGLTGLAAGAFAITLSWSYASLLVAVFTLGALYATAIPSTNRAVVHAVPPERTNLALGVKQVGVTGGSAISAVVVTGLASEFYWDAGFLATGIVALVVVAGFGLLYGGASGTGELRVPRPWAIDATAEYLLLVVAGFFFGAAMFTTTGYVVVFGTDSIGTPVAVAGLLLSTVQVAGSLSRVVSGQLLDWSSLPEAAGAPRLLTAYAVVAAVALILLGRVDTVTLAFPVAVALGFSLLGFMGVYYSYLTDLVPSGQMGEATAGAQTAVNAGAIVAPPAFGYIIDVASFTTAWTVLAACCLVAAIVFGQLARQG